MTSQESNDLPVPVHSSTSPRPQASPPNAVPCRKGESHTCVLACNVCTTGVSTLAEAEGQGHSDHYRARISISSGGAPTKPIMLLETSSTLRAVSLLCFDTSLELRRNAVRKVGAASTMSCFELLHTTTREEELKKFDCCIDSLTLRNAMTW